MTDEHQPGPPGPSSLGDLTRLAMNMAGLDRRRVKHRVGLLIGLALVLGLATVIVLDLTGVVAIPGMGLVYDATGFADPQAERAVERYEARLADDELSAKKRAALRARLLGAQERASGEPGAQPTSESNVGVEESRELDASERATLADVFASDDKRELSLTLKEPEEVQTPNLPEGLTGEAIQKVITDNAGSMRLCVAESARKGENVDGRMNVRITIGADGKVRSAEVGPPQMAQSVIGRCAARRIQGWLFPRFNGEPVTVEYPYVLQTSSF